MIIQSKIRIAFIAFFVLSSCSNLDPTDTIKDDTSFNVMWKGALKKMMHEGDLSAKIDLSDLENTEHLYALGAIENLKGDVQIFDSKPLNTLVAGDDLMFDKSFDKKAALLVYASVNKWKTIAIPESVKSYEQLEEYVKVSAKENQVNTNEPFPFLIEGTPKSFDWHVINWKDGDNAHSHEKHISSGLHGTVEGVPVQMLGFYSNSHHAIFTHHTTNMHIHVKTDSSKIAGHVDGLTLGDNMILKLPLIESL